MGRTGRERWREKGREERGADEEEWNLGVKRVWVKALGVRGKNTALRWVGCGTLGQHRH